MFEQCYNNIQSYDIAANGIIFFKLLIINCMACLFYDFIPDEIGVCFRLLYIHEALLTFFAGGKCMHD